jgi:hypothetical protein
LSPAFEIFFPQLTIDLCLAAEGLKMAYDAALSIDPLPRNLRVGLIVIATMALLSLTATSVAGVFIIYRISNGKRYQKTPLRYNQSLILILNLLIADFQQAVSFILSLHWLYKNAILAPTNVCSAQGWFVQIGDVSSGIFSLCIALQTFSVIVLQKQFPYKNFVITIIAVWTFCLVLSVISPLTHIGEDVFVSTGAWCWIAERYGDEVCFLPGPWHSPAVD